MVGWGRYGRPRIIKMKLGSKKMVPAKLVVTKESFGSFIVIGLILFMQEKELWKNIHG